MFRRLCPFRSLIMNERKGPRPVGAGCGPPRVGNSSDSMIIIVRVSRSAHRAKKEKSLLVRPTCFLRFEYHVRSNMIHHDPCVYVARALNHHSHRVGEKGVGCQRGLSPMRTKYGYNMTDRRGRAVVPSGCAPGRIQGLARFGQQRS